jgi:hypothetical protein
MSGGVPLAQAAQPVEAEQATSPRAPSIGFSRGGAEVQTRGAERRRLLVSAEMAIQPRMLIVGFVCRWKLERSHPCPGGTKACSRWSSAAKTTGSQPPSGRTPAGVPHLFKLEVQSVGVGLPERRVQAYASLSSPYCSEVHPKGLSGYPPHPDSYVANCCRRLQSGGIELT